MINNEKEMLISNRKILTDQLYQNIKNKIIRGKIKSGIKITETKLVSKFGTSRTSVRGRRYIE